MVTMAASFVEMGRASMKVPTRRRGNPQSGFSCLPPLIASMKVPTRRRGNGDASAAAAETVNVPQ